LGRNDLLIRTFLSRNLKGFDVVFIAGGFVKRKYLVDKIFHAGFKGITTSEPGLW
ncbi:glycerol-3-phosphate responsive antiterminator, partial [Klebsiella pneumoniae]